MALKAGLEIRFLLLAGAEKMDPDLLFLERGLAAYDDVKKSSCSAMAFACQSLLPQAATASAEQKSRAATALYEIIAQTDSDVTRMSFLSEIAQNLRVPQAALERDLRAYLCAAAVHVLLPRRAPHPNGEPQRGPLDQSRRGSLTFSLPPP